MAPWRGGGEHGEGAQPDHGGGAEQHGASAKRQRIHRQILLSSGSQQAGGEHGQSAEHDAAVATHAGRIVHQPAQSSASWREGGERGEAEAPDYGGGDELRGASAKRQRTLTQIFKSSGAGQVRGEQGHAGASEHGGSEHDVSDAPHDDGGNRVDSGAAEHCDGIEVDEDLATTSRELFLHDKVEDSALLNWLRERPEHPRCSALLEQIMEWTGKCTRREMSSLARAQGISLWRDGAGIRKTREIREKARRYFKAAVAQEKGRLACFQLNTTGSIPKHSDPLAREAERVLHAAEVVDMRTLLLFRKQNEADMPDHLQEAIRRLAGGYRETPGHVRKITKLLRMNVQRRVQYPGADRRTRSFREKMLTTFLHLTMLRTTCFRRVRAWATISPVLQSTFPKTPQTVLELANMLRDPNTNLRCPFGTDFEDQTSPGSRMDRSHRIPFWLALVELYSHGYRYGCRSDKHLPHVFEEVVDVVVSKRQERPQGAPEPLIRVCSDLTHAFMTNSVFRHYIATHDLVSYAMQHSIEYLQSITSEQLRHDGMMGPSGLMPTAVADRMAQTFFDFVVKHNLADTMVAMSAQQIQVIAIFLSHLQRKPPKRVRISERLDLIRHKPLYTPAEDIPSPEIPHFARFQPATDDAAEHSRPSQPIMQAPIICQLCGAGFLLPKDLWAHSVKEHHSWAEARKRLIFEVQQRTSVPLQPIEKRRLARNFMHDLLYSYPGRNTVQRDKCTMRQIVACAVCAVKDWIDDFYPCYMWKILPPRRASVFQRTTATMTQTRKKSVGGHSRKGLNYETRMEFATSVQPKQSMSFLM